MNTDNRRPKIPSPPGVLPHQSARRGLPPPVPLGPPGGNWQMTFEDEFDTEASIKGSNSPWITGYPWGQTLPNELQYYTRYDKDFPPFCAKGGTNHDFGSGTTMRLVAKSEPGTYEVWSWPQGTWVQTCVPYSYTSAMIFSKKKYLYGYFEIRAKVPRNGTVFWPAFWLWAGDGGGGRSTYSSSAATCLT